MPALVMPVWLPALVAQWLRQVVLQWLLVAPPVLARPRSATVLNMSRCARNSTSFARIAGSRPAATPLVPTAPGVAVAGAARFATEQRREIGLHLRIGGAPVALANQLVETCDQLLHASRAFRRSAGRRLAAA